MTDIVAEMKALEADLVRKLEAVRQFLSAYGETPASRPAATSRPARSMVDRIDKFGHYGKQVVEATIDLLPGPDGEPVLTRVLVDKLEFRGVNIRGENKVNALSALLARSSKIKGHGRAGWTRADAASDDDVGEDISKEQSPSDDFDAFATDTPKSPDFEYDDSEVPF